MFKKSKYDIMKMELSKLSLVVVSILLKLIRLDSKQKKLKITDDQMDIEIVKILDDFVPLMEKLSHIVYENNKDIKTMNQQQLIDYIQKKESILLSLLIIIIKFKIRWQRYYLCLLYLIRKILSFLVLKIQI